MRVKVRYMGEEPFKVLDTWVYRDQDIKLDPDIVKMLWSKYGKENFITLRDPYGLVGPVIKPSAGDGARLAEMGIGKKVKKRARKDEE